MTSDKRFKARIRARMAKTGERYTTARRHFVPAEQRRAAELGYALRSGQFPDSAAIANMLAHAGVTAPDGEPLSEPVVFGVMGGLGAGYILWEFSGRGSAEAPARASRDANFAHDDSRVVTLGFNNQWQYFGRTLRTGLDRLGIGYEHHTTGGARGATRTLDAVLEQRGTALVWPDRYHLGYWQLPATLDGHGGDPVVIYGRRGDAMYIDDRNEAPLTVDAETLQRARARVGSYKNTLVRPTPEPGPLDPEVLRTAIAAGIADCVEHLRSTSTSFSLPVWRKWARMMTDTRNAKGWPSVFADGRGLVGALLSVWEGTSSAGMTGGHLRGLYAEFLVEAGGHLGGTFAGAVEALQESSRLWTQLGDTAVDPAVDEYLPLRELTATIRESIAADGDEGRAEAAEAGAELWKRRTELDAHCPLDGAAISAVFGRMGELLERIFTVETAAIEDLAASYADLSR
jgi:hypothetical protein